MRINISDVIDSYWGISARSIRAQIADAARTGEALDIVVSSPGGSVYEGLQIYHEIKSYSGKKDVTVVGIAASIASVIAMAGDKIRMSKGSMMMIHNPWTYTAGNADELRKDADILDMLAESLSSIYSAKSGKTDKEIMKLMDAETYMTAKDAVSMGFATEEVETIASSSASAFALMNFAGENSSDQYSNLKAQVQKAKENLSREEKFAILKVLKPSNAQGAIMLTLEKIKAEAPELYAQILEEGKNSVDVESVKATMKTEHEALLASSVKDACDKAINSERDRVKAIKAMTVPGLESIVSEAIDSGKTPEQASMEIVSKITSSGNSVLAKIKSQEEAASNVPAAPEAPAENATDEQKALAGVKASLAELNEKGYLK